MNAPRHWIVARLVFAVWPRTVKTKSTRSLSRDFVLKAKFTLLWSKPARIWVPGVDWPRPMTKAVSRRPYEHPVL